MTHEATGTPAAVEDDGLDQRLDDVRAHIARQREQLRASRRRLREVAASAAVRADRAAVQVLRARGQAAPVPPVPSHPPDWLDDREPGP